MRQEDWLAIEFSEFSFAGGAAGLDETGDAPEAVGGGSNEMAVHGPVVILAEGEAVRGMVVPAHGERDEVGGIDKAEIVRLREADAEGAGGTLVIEDLQRLPAEG